MMKHLDIVLACGAGLCWGVGELFTKSVLHTKQIGPITAITVRTAVALPVLLVAYFVTTKLLHAERGDWHRTAETGTILKLVLGSGLVAGAAAMIFFYSALSVGDISRVKPIAFALAPALAVMMGWLILGEPMSAKKAVGVGMIVLGVVVLTGK
jgi:bacterial/archaeal transporter family protein